MIRAAGYATMLTRGTGPYADDAELLVRPLPSVREYRFTKTAPGVHQPVAQAMIREDVWQALLKIPLDGGVSESRRRARAAWYALGERLDDPRLERYRLKDLELEYSKILHDPLPTMRGLGTAFRTVHERAAEMTGDQVDDFTDTVGEFVHISNALMMTRYLWRPSESAGPQCGEWPLHESVLKAFTDVARVNAAAMESYE